MALRRILIVQGHPHPAGGHFCHALAASCADGAARPSNEVRIAEAPEGARRGKWLAEMQRLGELGS